MRQRDQRRRNIGRSHARRPAELGESLLDLPRQGLAVVCVRMREGQQAPGGIVPKLAISRRQLLRQLRSRRSPAVSSSAVARQFITRLSTKVPELTRATLETGVPGTACSNLSRSASDSRPDMTFMSCSGISRACAEERGELAELIAIAESLGIAECFWGLR